MKSIQSRFPQDPNVGGVWKIYWMPIDKIYAGLPHPVLRPFNDEVDLNNVYFNDSTGWFKSEFQLNSAEWEEPEEKITANGILYTSKVSWKVAKHYNFRRMDFDEMEHRQFAVFVLDNNGVGAFFGYKSLEGEKFGMVFKKKKTTGDKVTDLNYWTLTFNWESPYMAFNGIYVTGPIVEPGHGDTGGVITDTPPPDA